MRGKQPISKHRQKLIDAKLDSPLIEGERIFVYRNALTSYKSDKYKDKSEPCIILSLGAKDKIVVRYEDNSAYKDRYTITKEDIANRDLIALGANPFDESGDSIRPIAFTLESILFNLNIFDERRTVEGEYLFDGIVCTNFNWNPFVYGKDGEKEYYQRAVNC